MRNKQLPPPRFWLKVRLGPQCWEWTGFRDKRNYGRLGPVLAHRIAWELCRGVIPPGMMVLHTCDNPPCVRPDHLMLGTHAENMRQMRERGRAAHTVPASARLTVEQVRQIRDRLEAGELQRVIGEDFGITQGAVSHVKSGRCWGWLS